MSYDIAALTAAAQQVVDDAKRLGLTWTLQNGTVTATRPNIQVQMDGDAVSIQVVSMIGQVSAGVRVYVIQVPPAGNFIVGFVGNVNLSTVNTMFVTGGPSQTTTSSSFSNVLGPSSVPFAVSITKKFDDTALSIDASGTFYSTGSVTAPLFAVLVTGVSGNDANSTASNHWIGYLGTANPSLNQRCTWSGHIQLASLNRGLALCQLQWQRNSGAGTTTMDNLDACFMTVSEVWPS